MRALTIRQPWAHAIAHGPKRIENRGRMTNYRGPLLIHAGKTTDLSDDAAVEFVAEHAFDPKNLGAVVAVATLTGCHYWSGVGLGCCCEPWGRRFCWHWELDDVKALAEPVPARGMPGVWVPDADLVARCLEQVPA